MRRIKVIHPTTSIYPQQVASTLRMAGFVSAHPVKGPRRNGFHVHAINDSTIYVYVDEIAGGQMWHTVYSFLQKKYQAEYIEVRGNLAIQVRRKNYNQGVIQTTFEDMLQRAEQLKIKTGTR